VEELPSLSHSVTCKFHPLFTLRKTARVLLSLSLTLELNKERDFSSPEIELSHLLFVHSIRRRCAIGTC